jgi:hypothetical protein
VKIVSYRQSWRLHRRLHLFICENAVAAQTLDQFRSAPQIDHFKRLPASCSSIHPFIHYRCHIILAFGSAVQKTRLNRSKVLAIYRETQSTKFCTVNGNLSVRGMDRASSDSLTARLRCRHKICCLNLCQDIFRNFPYVDQTGGVIMPKLDHNHFHKF